MSVPQIASLQPHSMTAVIFCTDPTRTWTLSDTGYLEFKAHADKFVENKSMNRRHWGSGGQQVWLLEPLVRILTSELAELWWYWAFEEKTDIFVRFEGPNPFWARTWPLWTVRSGQVQGSGKWSNLNHGRVRGSSEILCKNRTEPDYGSTTSLRVGSAMPAFSKNTAQKVRWLSNCYACT